ncbi:immunoglobulin-like domain-containing protein [Listeria newyorkensis]|uniref:Peptidase M60 domain-containing protein n=1 Tax=Listeria newyorkensis TaxID=1497681 RepID=A0A841YXJ4_9LIST|nr:immunoglobulin-like domain-containing protein [Listeria newyorkensis]MBC1458140.1 hypothetical protein [Listeria newyorkensis]
MKKRMSHLFFMLIASIIIGGFSLPAHADEIRTKEAYVLEEPTWLNNAGMSKGRYHDRQSLNIIVPANVELEMRQINPKFTDELMVYFIGDGTKQPAAYVTSEWSSLKSTVDLVPFIQTPFTKERPILEYRVTNQMKDLPTYHLNDNQEAFFKKWDTEGSSYALVTSEYFQMLIPEKDKTYLKQMKDFNSINNLIDYYTDVFKTYNDMAGLSFTPLNPTDKNIPNKYFIQANAKANPISFAAYNNYMTAQTGDSLATAFLSKEWAWAALHEIGHGYQGAFIDPMVNVIMNPNDWGFDVNEVWNNQYAAAYQQKIFGKDIYKKGEIYANGAKENRENQVMNLWQNKHIPMQLWDKEAKLDMLIALNEKTASKGFTNFNKEFRKLMNQSEYNSSNTLLLDLISKYYAEASGFDFTSVLTSAGGKLSQKQKTENYYKKDQPVAPLAELLTPDKLANVQTQLGLNFPYALVDTAQLVPTELSGNVTLTLDIDDLSQIQNKLLVIRDGKKVVREVSLTNNKITLNSLPIGIYNLDWPTGDTNKYSVDTKYLRVKNGPTTVPVKYTAKQTSDLTKQAIHFKGVNSSEYSTAYVDLNNEKLTIENNYKNVNPSNGGALYSKIEILDLNNRVTYSREILGNSTLSIGLDETTIKDGYHIRIFHDNPSLLSIDNMTITGPSAKTHTFIVTKLGLQQKDSAFDMKASLATVIDKAAKEIQDNTTMLTSPYVEAKDDLLLAIQLLDNPAKSFLLDKYKDILPDTNLDPKNPLIAPTLDDLDITSTAISGKRLSEGGITMIVHNSDGSYRRYAYYSETDGSFNIPLNYYGQPIILAAGTRVELFYKKLDLISPSTIKSVTVPIENNLIANDYTFGDSLLTGKFDGDITKVRLWINDKVVTQATTSSDSSFAFNNAANFITKATDKVELVGVDKAYNEKKRILLSVKSSSVTTTNLTAAPYKIGTSTLTGTFGNSISKVRLWINGKVVTQATTTSNGSYTFTNIANFIPNATDKVEIVGVDSQYKELNRIRVIVTDPSPLDSQLSVDNFKIGDKTMTGSFGKKIAKVRLWINGKVVQQATTTNGMFTFTSTNYLITSPNDIVEIIGVDEQYKEVTKITIKC